MVNSFNKQVSMICPICGNDQFESIEVDDSGLIDVIDNPIFRCIDCGTAFMRDQLIEDNTEKISIAIFEMRKEIIKNVEDELMRVIKKW